jgi:hypothetical protein
VTNAFRPRPDDLVQDFVRDMQNPIPEAAAQLRSLLADQGQHLDRLRRAIARIGQSLPEIDSETQSAECDQPHILLLRAEAEAIQGLTLLAIKGQHLQAEMIAMVELMAHAPPPPSGQKWVYPAIGVSFLLSLIGILF